MSLYVLNACDNASCFISSISSCVSHTPHYSIYAYSHSVLFLLLFVQAHCLQNILLLSMWARLLYASKLPLVPMHMLCRGHVAVCYKMYRKCNSFSEMLSKMQLRIILLVFSFVQYSLQLCTNESVHLVSLHSILVRLILLLTDIATIWSGGCLYQWYLGQHM